MPTPLPPCMLGTCPWLAGDPRAADLTAPAGLGQEKQASNSGSFLGLESETLQNSDLEHVVQAQIQNL